MYEPMKCPICEKAWVRFTYFDTAGQHWVCPNCGSSDQNYTIFYDISSKKKED